MITLPELKLNGTVQVSIPTPAELFARFGMTTKKGAMSGDDTPKQGLSKVEQAAEVERVAIED